MSVCTRLHRLVFSREPERQSRLAVWSVSALSSLLFVAIQAIAVATDQMEANDACPLSATMLGSAAAFYVVLRWPGTLGRRAYAGVAMAQLGISVALCLWGYAVTGPVRGAVLLVLVSSLMYGIFVLRAWQWHVLLGGSLGGLALVLVLLSVHDSVAHPPAVALVYFMITVVVMATVVRLASLLGVLRVRVRQQAYQLHHAMEKLQRLANDDELTQLPNRRHTTEMLQELLANAAARPEVPACVALLDIDHFKVVNDVHGHAAGDGVLRHFAQTVRQVLGGAGLAGRWGGEEFLVLFRNTGQAMALEMLDELRTHLRHTDVAAVVPGLCVRFSAGLTAVRPGDTVESLAARADHALYRAKNDGRNRSAIA